MCSQNVSANAMKLNQLTIPCSDYASSVCFYKTMGFRQIVDSAPDYARFETEEGTTFSIHAVTAPSTSNGLVIYFEVDDVDATVARLVDLGIEFEVGPTDQSWLWREAYTRDLSGNRICIYHAGKNRRFPPWRLGD